MEESRAGAWGIEKESRAGAETYRMRRADHASDVLVVNYTCAPHWLSCTGPLYTFRGVLM